MPGGVDLPDVPGAFSRRRFLVGGIGLGTAAWVPISATGWPHPAVREGGSGLAHLTSDANPPGAPVALTVDGLSAPIGLSAFDLHFGWHLDDPRRGALQSAYRIVVQPAPGSESGVAVPVLWDSGRIAGDEQAFVAYEGPPLASDASYVWTVQTWAQGGSAGPFAPLSTFETGLQDGDWHAQWIWRPQDPSIRPDQYTYARKAFSLGSSPVVRARAYVSGDQQYELYVNGTRVGKGQAYSFPDTQYYETLDVTAQLVAGGRNALAVLHAWQGASKGHPAGAAGMIAQLSVLHADGTREVVVTDGSWRVRQGAWLPGTQRDIEGDNVDYTENIDGRLIPSGWTTATFDDSGWEQATVVGPAGIAPWTHLVSVRTRIVEEAIPPVSLTPLSSGAVVADFGKVYAASPVVSFHQGAPGRVVAIRAGYLLDEFGSESPERGQSGQVSVAHGTQHTNMSYSYVQNGGAEQFYAFDFLGFRYLQIDDPGESLDSGDVLAVARHSAVPDTAAATFSCSSPTIDAIFELGRHSALYTAQEQFLDTPTREKGPWLWDGFNESQTAMVAFGEQNLTRRALLEFSQSQKRYWRNGAVNKIYPTGLGAQDIDEFTEIYPEWVWQYWLHTGDRTVLSAVYPSLVGVADYIARSVSRSTGLVTGLPSTEPVSTAYPVLTRVNVLGANVFRRASDAAQALGRPRQEIEIQRHRAAQLVAAINGHLVDSDGLYRDGYKDGSVAGAASQDANACALAYEVVPAHLYPKVAAHIASKGMDVQPRTATEVLRALAHAGRVDDVVRILTDDRIDGWANILTRGASFTWEVWRPSDANGDSMSHGWGSNVLVEIVRLLLGVQPVGPGYAAFTVTPPMSALSWASGTCPTPRGPITVTWRRHTASRSSSFDLDVVVPANAVATLEIPAPTAGRLTEGGRSAESAEGVHVLSSAPPRMVVRVGAGSYHFVLSPGRT